MTEAATLSQPDPADDKFPDGTTESDRHCWVCNGDTAYRNCKIICKNCGFTRDCSDP
jgi:hypothetical protein